jgi:hypothetical protein
MTTAHDDTHSSGEMAYAAACYVLESTPLGLDEVVRNAYWPWHETWWKPTTKRRNLIKAAALIIAEIERLDRLSDITDKDSI